MRKILSISVVCFALASMSFTNTNSRVVSEAELSEFLKCTCDYTSAGKGDCVANGIFSQRCNDTNACNDSDANCKDKQEEEVEIN